MRQSKNLLGRKKTYSEANFELNALLKQETIVNKILKLYESSRNKIYINQDLPNDWERYFASIAK